MKSHEEISKEIVRYQSEIKDVEYILSLTDDIKKMEECHNRLYNLTLRVHMLKWVLNE